MIDEKEWLEERAAIGQYDGGLTRREAEQQARELLEKERRCRSE